MFDLYSKKEESRGSQGEYVKKLEHLDVAKPGFNCNNCFKWEGGEQAKEERSHLT